MMFQFNRATIGGMIKAMAKGEVSSLALTRYYMTRIAEFDEEKTNAVLEINPDALFIAERMDELRKSGELLGPLHGVPILLKDNISTADKMHTSAGSVTLANNFAPYDATVASKLREAGAVILGKANLTEFANILTRGMANGYSSRGGQVYCPYDRQADPWGSSTGSAAAVAADMCAGAIGTETCGSIMSPAIANGVVGLKPTLGMVSRHGIIPISHTLDTAGPMTRSVEDAAIMLDAITGYDEKDPATYRAKAYGLAEALDKNALKDCRIGIHRARMEDLDEDAAGLNAHMLSILKDAGAVLVEIQDIVPSQYEWDIMKYELKINMDYYLSTLSPGRNPQTMNDIIQYNQQHAKQALRYGQSIFLEAQNEASGSLKEKAYNDALCRRYSFIEELDRVFDSNEIDVLLNLGRCILAPISGFPSINVPIGLRSNNRPVGSYWMARRFDEKTLIKVAYAFEQALGLYMNPGFLIISYYLVNNLSKAVKALVYFIAFLYYKLIKK